MTALFFTTYSIFSLFKLDGNVLLNLQNLVEYLDCNEA